ncbi:hypothetical protein IE53DRAFT_30258 [Violaceomyces palustris]|uniref:Uncharacterized protein n=1 Tax=Violaceomyces palustris TaxID=1673888 RepID=A0ACD0P1H5_9BASI|nr:hypothetical protein IE53DRAFT_30258 [Violaceomyces palustris]
MDPNTWSTHSNQASDSGPSNWYGQPNQMDLGAMPSFLPPGPLPQAPNSQSLNGGWDASSFDHLFAGTNQTFEPIQMPSSFYSTSGSSLASALDFSKGPNVPADPGFPMSDFTASSSFAPNYGLPFDPNGAYGMAPPEQKPTRSPPTLAQVFGASRAVATRLEQKPLAQTTSSSSTSDPASKPRSASPSASPTTTPPKPEAAKVRTPGSASQVYAEVTSLNAAAPRRPKESLLLPSARALLAPSVIERNPKDAARKLIDLLSEKSKDGKFSGPRPTTCEERTEIIELAEGSGINPNCSTADRLKYLDSWVGDGNGRAILGSWLAQATPPKSATTVDTSVKYRKSLSPLLALLRRSPMKLAYLQDEVGLGKLVTAVAKRSTKELYRSAALGIKEKWSKLVKIPTAPNKAVEATSKPNGTAVKAIGSSLNGVTGKRAASSLPESSDASVKKPKVAPLSSSSSHTNAGATASSKTTAAGAAKPRVGAVKADSSFFGSAKPAPLALKRPLSGPGSNAAKRVALPGAGSNPSSSSLSSSATAAAAAPPKPRLNFMDIIESQDAAKSSQSAKQEMGAKGKKKGKKSVRWKEDDKLVQVRMIEVAIYEDDQDGGLTTGGVSEKGIGDLDHEEGDALRHAHMEMEEAIDWYPPREVLIVHPESEPNPEKGCESSEARVEVIGAEAKGDDVPSPATPTTPTGSPPPSLYTESKEMTVGDYVQPFDFFDQEAYSGDDSAGGSVAITATGPEATQDMLVDSSPSAAAGASTSGLPVSDILAKLGTVMSGASQPLSDSMTPSHSSSDHQASTSASTATAAAPINLDINLLQSILRNANANSSSSSATTTTTTSVPPTGPRNASANNVVTTGTGLSPNVLGLLANLSSSFGGAGGRDPTREEQLSQEEAPEADDYWNRTYRNNPPPRPLLGGQPNFQLQQDQQHHHHHHQQPGWVEPHHQAQPWQNQQQQPSGPGMAKGLALQPIEPTLGGPNAPPCKWWKAGRCRFASSCNFSHIGPKD